MKIITKNLIQPGMKLRSYVTETGRVWESEFIVKAIIDNEIQKDMGGYYCLDDLKTFTFELLAYPERRPFTWEYAKSKVDEWPLTIYNGKKSIIFEYGNKNKFRVTLNGLSTFIASWDENYFIDLPFPEIPDVQEPWLNENYSIVKGVVALETPAILEENKPSLWWVKSHEDLIFLHPDFKTKKEITKTNHTLKAIVNDFTKIQPYNKDSQFGPLDDRWEKVI